MRRLLLWVLSVTVLSLLAQPLHAQDKKAKTQTASGTVKSVSNSSMTITDAGGKDMSFTIDSSTKFIGKGLSTKTAQKGKMTATDSVGMNDKVSVSYHDMSGTLHAAEVRIISKAAKK